MKKFIKTLIIYISLLVFIFILVFIGKADAIGSQETLFEIPETFGGDCNIATETTTNQIKFNIDERGVLQEVRIEMKKNNPFLTGTYSPSIIVNDELLWYNFYSIGNLTTSYQEQVFEVGNIYVDETDDIEFSIFVLGSIAPDYISWKTQTSLNPATSICRGFNLANSDMDIEVLGLSKKTFDKFSFIATAHASTTCEFILSGATTTAECSNSQIDNPSFNVWSGLVIFFIMFFGLIFYFKK